MRKAPGWARRTAGVPQARLRLADSTTLNSSRLFHLAPRMRSGPGARAAPAGKGPAHRLSRPRGISNRVDQLLDRRQQLAQRLEDHEVDRLVRALPEPRVRPKPEDL